MKEKSDMLKLKEGRILMAERIGEGGYRYILKHYTVESNMKKYEENLSRLVKDKF